jgi:Domain found in Dishevelled, Egl-10, and Pleckstrin (DEP)
MRFSHRTQKNCKEVAQTSMDAEHSWSLYIERVYLCPVQSRTQISHRQACASDKLQRVNVHRTKSSDIQTQNDTEKSCDFYNDRGYIIIIKNWQSEGKFTSWEFHLPTCALKDLWLRTLRAARIQSEEAENSNRLFFRELSEKLYRSVEIRDRHYLLKTYKKCFVGCEFVKALCEELNCNVEEALSIGNSMMSFGLFSHVRQEHELQDAFLFYHFCDNNLNHLLSMSKDTSRPPSPTDFKSVESLDTYAEGNRTVDAGDENKEEIKGGNNLENMEENKEDDVVEVVPIESQDENICGGASSSDRSSGGGNGSGSGRGSGSESESVSVNSLKSSQSGSFKSRSSSPSRSVFR